MMRLLWLALVILLGGCTGTETGNPKPPALELRFTGFSNEFGRVSVGLAGGALEVDRAHLRLSKVVLLPCAASGKRVEVDVGAVELTERPPELVLVETEETQFCGAQVLLAPDASDTSSELAGGRSVLVSGRRAADGVPFSIKSGLELSVELKNTATATPFPSRKLLLGFDLNHWLQGVGIETATPANGAITIDETHLPDSLTTFEAQAARAPAIYDDADGNGLLAGDNQAPAAGP
jgi:hypothetical protein